MCRCFRAVQRFITHTTTAPHLLMGQAGQQGQMSSSTREHWSSFIVLTVFARFDWPTVTAAASSTVFEVSFPGAVGSSFGDHQADISLAGSTASFFSLAGVPFATFTDTGDHTNFLVEVRSTP